MFAIHLRFFLAKMIYTMEGNTCHKYAIPLGNLQRGILSGEAQYRTDTMSQRLVSDALDQLTTN